MTHGWNRCPSCNYHLGDVLLLFDAMREKHIRSILQKKFPDRDITNVSRQVETHIDITEMFDILNIPTDKYCCRMRLANKAEMHDYLKGGAFK